MASNISSNSWCVKVVSLPKSITIDQLARTFNTSASHISIPKIQKYDTCFAWVNDFHTENAARMFANQWTDSLIFGTPIKCNALEVKNKDLYVHHAPVDIHTSVVRVPQNPVFLNQRLRSHSSNIFDQNQNTPFSFGPPSHHMTRGSTTPFSEQRLISQHLRSNPASQSPQISSKFLILYRHMYTSSV